jgi:hypothetical protein
LKCFTNLKRLFLYDAHFGENPVCHLSNYQTFTLAQILSPSIQTFDGFEVSDEAK